MDELEISGKRYISTKRIAKENRYHPDYVGQLIRAGRISGMKVGRAWYVDEASFAEYLGKERGVSLATPVRPAQDSTSPQSGEFAATNSPTYAAVAAPYISAEVVPATAAPVETFAIVEPPYVPAVVEAAQETNEKFVSEATPIVTEAKPRSTFKTSLTYIPDNSPLFPAIQKRTKPAVETKKEEYVVAQIAKPANVVQQISRSEKSNWKTGFAAASVMAAAVIFFSFAFFGSLGINSTVVVERGKPASVAFVQEKTFCFIFGNCQNGQK